MGCFTQSAFSQVLIDQDEMIVVVVVVHYTANKIRWALLIKPGPTLAMPYFDLNQLSKARVVYLDLDICP